MFIENHNINDFCTMITTCFLNGIKDIRIFITEKELNKQIQFTYVLFTPLYTAIYSETTNNNEYKIIYNTLEECQDNICNHEFRIQVFDEISFNSEKHILTVGKETNVI